MPTAQCVSILSSPQIDRCSVVIKNLAKKLVIILTLQGANAIGFAKDLESQGHNWPSDSPEIIHQSLLDLLGFCRKNKLQVELSLSALVQDQLIVATHGGSIYLYRAGQAREILSSQGEIRLVLGKYRPGDLLILRSHVSSELSTILESLLSTKMSLESLVSELSVFKQNRNEIEENLTFVSYQESELPSSSNSSGSANIYLSLQKVGKKLIVLTKEIAVVLKKIYLTIKKQDKKKIISGLLVAFFIVAAGVAFRQVSAYQQNQKFTQTQNALAAITPKLDEVKTLSSTKPIEARRLAEQIITELKALNDKHTDKKSQALIKQQLDEMTTLATQIAAENSLDQLQIAYNLDSFLGRKITSNAYGIFILETDGKEILWIKTDQNQQSITLPDQSSIKNMSASEKQLFIHGQNGLYLFDLETSTTKQIKSSGESDQDATIMASFGPYVYLLNQEKRNIYRYYYQDEQLSEPIGWLIDKQGLNFATQYDMLVDGDLWLTDEVGQISKYSRGNKIEFSAQGIKEPTSNPLILANHQNTNQLIVLEKAKRRLLVLTKEGQLVSEIKSNELSGVTSITVDQNQNILALSGSTIYQIDL